MTTRNFALVAGIVYLVVGVLGFVPPLLAPPPAGSPPVRFDFLYGYLFGLFPVNAAHSLVHLLLGAWGVIASQRVTAARTYAASLAVIYGVLTIMGLLPGLNTVFGLIPIYSHDVWLHALTALVAAYFGFGRARGAEALREDVRRAA
jgi:hypothetical protein